MQLSMYVCIAINHRWSKVAKSGAQKGSVRIGIVISLHSFLLNVTGPEKTGLIYANTPVR